MAANKPIMTYAELLAYRTAKFHNYNPEVDLELKALFIHPLKETTMSDLIVAYATACCTNPVSSGVVNVVPTIYIYTQVSIYEEETGYYISNIDLNNDDPESDNKFAKNNVFVPVERRLAKTQADICRKILAAAGVNVVIVRF